MVSMGVCLLRAVSECLLSQQGMRCGLRLVNHVQAPLTQQSSEKKFLR